MTLHLRRGDYMKCDTSPAAVVRYLQCSMDKDDVKKVVVLTNWREEICEEFGESIFKKVSE